MGKLPKVEIDGMEFEESNYVNHGKRWSAKTLYDAVKIQKLKPFDIPLAAINLSELNFTVNSTTHFIFQSKRVMNCDINIPIILDSDGAIADGSHRVCRAILDGKSSIKGYRLKSMPTPDEQE